MNIRSPRSRRSVGFTLIELLTVMCIIAILVGLLLTGIQIAKEMARKAQTRVAEAEISGAVKHYYSDYGKYPLGKNAPDPSASTDVMFGDGRNSNQVLFDILRNVSSTPGQPNEYNPNGTVYFETHMAADPLAPKGGFAPQDAGNIKQGAYVDPWGNEYRIAIDADGDNKLSNLPYSDLQGAKAPQIGVGVFSIGKDGALGNKGDGVYRNGSTPSDDILSWQ